MSATLTPAVLRRLFVAPLLVLLSALAYHGAVHPAFQVVRVPLIDGARQPTAHLVRVMLPDLSVLRQSVPILTGQLANGPARRQRARVFLGGVSRAEIDLAPGSGRRFALVLSEGTARAITGGTGGQYEVGHRGRQRRLAPDLSGGLKRLCGRRSGGWRSCLPRSPRIRPCRWVAWALLVVLGTLAIVLASGPAPHGCDGRIRSRRPWSSARWL